MCRQPSTRQSTASASQSMHAVAPCEEGGKPTGPMDVVDTNEVALPSPDFEAADVTDRVDNIRVDSGTPHDRISEFIAAMLPTAMVHAPPIRRSTANGVVRTDRALQVLHSMLGNEVTSAYILKQTPTAISLSTRCMDKGYSYVWLSSRCPLFVLPDGRVAILDVIRNCPYLSRSSMIVEADDPQVEELCGGTPRRRR